MRKVVALLADRDVFTEPFVSALSLDLFLLLGRSDTVTIASVPLNLDDCSGVSPSTALLRDRADRSPFRGVDREMTAELLDFYGPTLNSMDSVSDRDYLIEFLNALSI